MTLLGLALRHRSMPAMLGPSGTCSIGRPPTADVPMETIVLETHKTASWANIVVTLPQKRCPMMCHVLQQVESLPRHRRLVLRHVLPPAPSLSLVAFTTHPGTGTNLPVATRDRLAGMTTISIRHRPVRPLVMMIPNP